MKKIFLTTIIFLIAFISSMKPAAADYAAKIMFLEGDVTVKMEGEKDWVKARKAMLLESGDTLKTGRRSWAEIAFDDEVNNIVRVSEKSELVIGEVSPSIRLSLLDGEIHSLIEKLDEGSTFEVQTPTAVCGVRGSGLGAKTDGNKTTVGAYEHDGFAKGITKDGSPMDEETIVKEGFKTVIERFKGPSKLMKLTQGEKKKWRSWRERLEDMSAGAIDSGKGGKLDKLDSISEKFEKVKESKEDILEKQDTDRIEKYRKQDSRGGSSGGESEYRY